MPHLKTIKWTPGNLVILPTQDSSMSVVIIDWRAGALPDRDEPLVPYPSANAQVVARLTRNLIHSMQAKGLGLSDVSCGGHSVGSHLCGYIGKEFKVDQIGRVSGKEYRSVHNTVHYSFP